ncbi:MAG: RodZ domain-containing protein [Trueperaceae bacterium]
MSDDVTMDATPGRPERLGDRLRAARERAGLELSELAQRTHVRRAYLEALEDGRYADLPEDVYTRNFVRLHAQAVGLDPAPLLDLYAHERLDAVGRSTLERRLDHDRREAVAPLEGSADRSTPPRPSTRESFTSRAQRAVRLPAWLGPTFATVLLVVVVVGLAAWGVDRFFANPPVAPAGQTAAAPEASDDPLGDDGAGADADAPGDATASPSVLTGPGASVDAIVRVDLITDPPGAEVTVDGFAVPGRTPILDVPFTARAGRVVRAELEGHAAAQEVVDLLENREVRLALAPLGDAPTVAAPAADGALTLSVVDTTWLEVYTGDARNAGERLVYTTAQAGDAYDFDLPVFVYVGNAAGVRVALEGQDLGAMGGPGAVLGRAFGP